MNNKRKAAALTTLLLVSLILTACGIIEAIDKPGCPDLCEYTVRTHTCDCSEADPEPVIEELLEQQGFVIPKKEEHE